MTSSTRADALDVLAAALQLSRPLNTTTSGTSSVSNLPISIGSLALSVLSNVISSGSAATSTISTGAITTTTETHNFGSNGLGINEAASVNAALDILSATMLRSASPGDAPISITSNSPFSAGNVQGGGAGCSQGLSMTSILIDASYASTPTGYGGASLPLVTPTTSSSSSSSSLPSDASMLHFPLSAPLSTCGIISQNNGVTSLTGSATLVAFAPPPTLRLPQSLFATLRNTTTGSTGIVAVRIVQWGISPYNETSGLNKVTVSNPAANANAVSVSGVTTDANRRRNRLLHQVAMDFLVSGGNTYDVDVDNEGGDSNSSSGMIGRSIRWLQSIVTATVSSTTVSSTATSSVTAAASALTPAATSVSDLIPSRPLDARVVSVDLSIGGTAQTTFTSPIYVTIPLRDLSIVTFNAQTGEPESIAVGQSSITTREFTLVCPLITPTILGTFVSATLINPLSTIRQMWQESPWVNVTGPSFNLSATLALGAPMNARLKSITAVGYMTELIQNTGVAPIAGSESFSPAGTTAAGHGIGGGVSGFIIGNDATNASSSKLNHLPMTPTTALTLVYAVDCGPVFGEREVACGPGSGGFRVHYTCPSTSIVPTCLWFSIPKGEWTTDGCQSIRVTATAITCACNHLTSFAVRYAAVEHASSSVFAIDTPLERTTPFALQSLYLIVFFTVALTAVIGTVLGYISDAKAARGYASALASRPPVLALFKTVTAASQLPPPIPWFVDKNNPLEEPLPDAAPSARLLDAMVYGDVVIGSPSPGAGVGRHTGTLSAVIHTVWPVGPGAAAPPRDVEGDAVASVSPGTSPVRPNETSDAVLEQKSEAPPTLQQQTLARLFARLSSIAYKSVESTESAEAAFVKYETDETATTITTTTAPSTSPSPVDSRVLPVPVSRRHPVPSSPQLNGRDTTNTNTSQTPQQLLAFGTALERRAAPLLKRVRSTWKAHGAPLVPLCRARLRWLHPLALLGPLSDPRSPRPMRWALAVGLGLQSLLFLTAASYSFLWGSRDARGAIILPVLSANGIGFLTLFSLFFSSFIHSMWVVLLRGAARGEWGARFTHIAAEKERRKAAQAFLDSLPLPTLARAAARLLHRVNDARIFDEKSPAARVDAINRSGWVDAPRGCVTLCSPILRCCGRHPIQKRVFMQRTLAQAEGFVGMALRRAARHVGVHGPVSEVQLKQETHKSASVAPAPAPALPPSDVDVTSATTPPPPLPSIEGPSQALLAAVEAVELESAWEFLVQGAGSSWYVDSWRIFDFEAARESWSAPAATVSNYVSNIYDGVLRLARITHKAAIRLRGEVRALLDGTPVARTLQHTAGGTNANEIDDSEEQYQANLAAAELAAREVDTQLAREAAEAERLYLLEEVPANEATAAAWVLRAEARGPRPSRNVGEPWLPRGCKFRSALIWFGYTVYIAFATYFTLLFGLTISEGPLGSLVASAALAAIAEWTILPVIRATLGAVYDTRILPLLSPHLAWIPWFGRASGAVTALRVSTLARAAACNDLPDSKTAKANEGGDGCDAARATAVREAAGGPLLLPFSRAISDAAILASAATLPMRHAPALALATAESGVFGALALTDSEFRAPIVHCCSARTSSGVAAARNARLNLAVARMRHALTTSIYYAVTEGNGWHTEGEVVEEGNALRIATPTTPTTTVTPLAENNSNPETARNDEENEADMMMMIADPVLSIIPHSPDSPSTILPGNSITERDDYDDNNRNDEGGDDNNIDDDNYDIPGKPKRMFSDSKSSPPLKVDVATRHQLRHEPFDWPIAPSPSPTHIAVAEEVLDEFGREAAQQLKMATSPPHTFASQTFALDVRVAKAQNRVVQTDILLQQSTVVGRRFPLPQGVIPITTSRPLLVPRPRFMMPLAVVPVGPRHSFITSPPTKLPVMTPSLSPSATATSAILPRGMLPLPRGVLRLDSRTSYHPSGLLPVSPQLIIPSSSPVLARAASNLILQQQQPHMARPRM